jgi:hypothetical protein
MNLERVDQIAKAVLYEGYMLYPYRPSSVKNRQRFNFGVLYPRSYSEAQGGTEPCSMRTECLVRGDANGLLEVRVRFLHLQERSRAGQSADSWQEALEREVCPAVCPIAGLMGEGMRHEFEYTPGLRGIADSLSSRQEKIHGRTEITIKKVREDLFKLSVRVFNTTPLPVQECSRDEALMRSMVSTHIVLGLEGAEFISLLEPPSDLRDLAAECENAGAWPVLVGDPGQRDTILASPIILYDYPQIAPESAGDLFDGTEIDEILSLRIMTLTDDEKREIRESDARARLILERTESMPAEQFMKLHGALRSLRPLSEETP